MLKDLDSQGCSTPQNNPSPPGPLAPHLKLVVSNPPSAQNKPSAQGTKSTPGFTAEIRKRGSSHYVLIARDSFHDLECGLMMKIVESEDEDLGLVAVTCQFPPISDEKLNDFIEEDQTLIGMIMIEFHMKILEQLLLFCIAQNAPILVIHVDDTLEDNALGICRKIVVYEDKVPTKKGQLIQLTIPSNSQTFKCWIDFMEEVRVKFSRTLWQEKASNPTMRQYLKSCAILQQYN